VAVSADGDVHPTDLLSQRLICIVSHMGQHDDFVYTHCCELIGSSLQIGYGIIKMIFSLGLEILDVSGVVRPTTPI
jgi:hypothetical protein